ncbi:Yhi9p [Sugiyamaella lignohabitans]|uniref:Yhi9p n=1 Tax=Sugiyamaella lignohabitans TaxID=796027 RepID=A0A167EXT2_9ASCO|nr:Yhi9p [Sugiyamaella lignohabitans]ANB14585.1 Yhi9p [Sugiyamaella lignohabitans]
MTTAPFTTVDVFSDTRFLGNQLAIVELAGENTDLSTDNLQQIAREFNYSETIYIYPPSTANTYPVRIFTPDTELPFAGHPTIGAADHVIGLVTAGTSSATLVPPAGPIPVQKSSDGVVRAHIPHNVHFHKATAKDLPDPVGFSSDPVIAEAERNAPLFSIVKGLSFALIRLPSVEVLSRVKMSSTPLNLAPLLDHEWNSGFVGQLYYVLEDEHTVRARMILLDQFEDPATGSANSALGAYLALTTGKNQNIQVTQGVEIGRRSVIGVEVELDGDKINTLILSGKTVKVTKGDIIVSADKL